MTARPPAMPACATCSHDHPWTSQRGYLAADGHPYQRPTTTKPTDTNVLDFKPVLGYFAECPTCRAVVVLDVDAITAHHHTHAKESA